MLCQAMLILFKGEEKFAAMRDGQDVAIAKGSTSTAHGTELFQHVVVVAFNRPSHLLLRILSQLLTNSTTPM